MARKTEAIEMRQDVTFEPFCVEEALLGKIYGGGAVTWTG